MKDQSQEAGDSSYQHQAGRDMEVHHHGLTVEQVGELKKYIDGEVVGEVERFVNQQLAILRSDFEKYTGQAHAQALALGHQLLTGFVEQLAAKAPQNIESIKTPAMQQAILNAQTSAAVAGDEELTQTLVDILIDKSGAEPRSFKGVVLTEALQVAGKLTADQVNLLTALVMLSETISHGWNTIELVLDGINARCQPLYGKIPTSASALQYMAYTGVGAIERSHAVIMGPTSIYDTINGTYDSVFTNGFPVEDLPDELQSLSTSLIQVDERVGDINRVRFPFASSQVLNNVPAFLSEPFLAHKDTLTKLITANRSPVTKLREIVSADKPELAQFLSDLDAIGASSFMLSSVGTAVGQANWRRILPEDAPDVDIYLR